MNSVIEKLAEVEETAEAIVEHARQQKSEIEKQIQEERNQFDRDLEEETQKKRKKDQKAIDDLKREYEENHDIYAEEIVRHMIEV